MSLRATTFLFAAAAGLGLLALPRVAHAQDERSPVVTGDTPLPFAYNYGEVDTTRSGAMSGALRATGYSTTAPFLNPALMTFSKVYHMEAFGEVTPEYGRMVFGSTIVDSVTTKLAGGTSVSGGFLDSFSDPATSVDRTWVDVRLALAYPIVDEFSVGIAGRYMKLSEGGTGPLGASKVSGGQQDPEGDGRLDIVNIPTFDAGIAIKAGDLVRIGISGQNLTYMNDGILPTIVGGGIGIAHPSFTVEVDAVADLTSYGSPTARLMLGGEYLIKDMVPIRVGYRWDQGADSHQISAGLGYNSPEFKIEASVRRTVFGPESTEVIFGAAYHLDSSGLTGQGEEF
ncbi:MAG: hypothetical protein U0271_13190 [Polyangiaceae bacterium]